MREMSRETFRFEKLGWEVRYRRLLCLEVRAAQRIPFGVIPRIRVASVVMLDGLSCIIGIKDADRPRVWNKRRIPGSSAAQACVNSKRASVLDTLPVELPEVLHHGTAKSATSASESARLNRYTSSAAPLAQLEPPLLHPMLNWVAGSVRAVV